MNTLAMIGVVLSCVAIGAVLIIKFAFENDGDK